MTIHTPTPGVGCFAQRDSISDPALAHIEAQTLCTSTSGVYASGSLETRLLRGGPQTDELRRSGTRMVGKPLSVCAVGHAALHHSLS
jgi:hypothetical protein